MPWSNHAIICFLVIAYNVPYIVAAQQQQPLSNVYQRSPPENAALDPSRRGLEVGERARISTAHKHGKDTAVIPENERAIATFAPAESAPAVRARPAGPSVATGVSRHPARSLQDWQVEDIILLATVDGKIHARERSSGAARWELEVDRPMVDTAYHQNNKSKSKDLPGEDDFLWIVEPSQDGALYVYAPGSRLGMQKLGLTVRQLVEELSPYAGDDPPVVYTAEKRNTLYTVDASNGNILKMFSSAGSVTNNERSCRKANALETIDDNECEPIGTLTLGRTEYTVRIQDRDTGEPICTISYFEWSPNIRDKDLQSQYATTLDNKYIYSKHDGGIMALEHVMDTRRGRRSTVGQSLMYSHKFSSPVARVYDVVRPFGIEEETNEASLVILPQPVGPVNDDWPATDNIFVNCTESGSWYALSEQSYPLVTDGASRATCYMDDIYMPSVSLGAGVLTKQHAKLIGVHPLSALPSDAPHIPTIGGPEPGLLVEGPDGSMRPRSDNALIANPSGNWSSMLPSPLTIALMTIILVVLFRPMHQKWPRLRQMVQGHAPQTDASVNPEAVAVETEPVAAIVPESEKAPETATEERKVRFPEPAEETIFPQQLQLAEQEGEEALVESVSRDSIDENTGDPSAVSDTAPLVTASPKPEKEKKARRGVRGGRKVKEKRVELEQAQQRRRANSQNEKKSVDATSGKSTATAEVASIINNVQPVDTVLPQIITVDASESPMITGKIQINNLIIDTDHVIGHGSAGTCVFEGSFEGNEVAVKRMLSQYYELASQEVSFLQQRDDHPNVIKYFCQQKDQHFLYIALELCQASLMDLYHPQNPDEERREQLGGLLTAIQLDMPKALQQLAAGLHHLHSRRIIHRDIKPQNILIAKPRRFEANKGPRMVISDFGLCKTLPENVSTLVDPTGNAGTCGWKAPELISQPKDTASNNGHSTQSQSSLGDGNGGAGGLKRAADIFSLGCLFFWVLTGGSHPFDDKEGWAQIREFNIKKNNLQNMHKLDLGSDTEEPMQLITAMLAHRPEDRPSADDVLKHPFFWDSARRLAFLCDVSDHFEREPRDPPSWQLEVLESWGPTAIEKGDFLRVLPSNFVDTLGKQRKYTGSRMLDLLRALRNKKNHYEDMPEEVKRKVGPLPGGYLQFWTVRFPKLLMACYWIVKECEIEKSDRFRSYFEVEE